MVVALALGVVASSCGGESSEPAPPREPATAIRYVALGDSYTIGEGVAARERWPDRLAARLTREGVAARVVANPARTGDTTEDVLTRQLPVLDGADAGLATLQIGVNDWVQGVSADRFRANVTKLLDAIPRRLGDRRRFAVVTIPDFASTPAGSLFTGGRNGTAGIARFNSILEAEARRRGIPVADVFPVSRRVRVDPALLAADALHPSGKQYAAWEALIYPVVRERLGR